MYNSLVWIIIVTLDDYSMESSHGLKMELLENPGYAP
jgi:hypothetical protein